MAHPTIYLQGASYPDVPSVVLPVTGGGTARFTDVTDTTAVAGQVAEGAYFYNAAGERVAGTSSGGGELPVWQDSDGWVHVSDTAAAPVEIYSDDGYVVLDMEPPALTLQAKTYTVDSAGTETVTADSGYDGLSSVAVSVPSADVISWFDCGYTTVGGSRKWLVETGYVRNDGDDGNGWLSNNDVKEHTFNAVPANTSVTPSTSAQTIGGADYMMEGAVTVAAMPTGSATAPATISGTAATVSTGNNTLTLSKTVSVTPSVTAGYVSSGTAGNSSVSLTANVTTQAAQTIYPSTSDQSIAASRYLTGAQTIKGVTTSNLTADNIKDGVTVTVGDSADADRILSVTGTYSGGGASNLVQGTFTTSSTTGAAQTINIPYTGNGRPIFAHVEISGGILNNDFYSAVRNRSVGSWTASPNNKTKTLANYDTAAITVGIKTTTASSVSFSGNARTYYVQSFGASSTSQYETVTFTSATQLSVFVSASGTFGLMPESDYDYYIVYSE